MRVHAAIISGMLAVGMLVASSVEADSGLARHKKMFAVPRPGAAVKMDLGYIFGNSTGTKATSRSYWSNNGFSANVLDDVPNESRLTPNEWGLAMVE